VALPALRLSLASPGGAPVSQTLGVRALLVGTSAECDLTAVDPRMSRRHCEIRLTERGVLVRDLGSKNGTFVGDASIVEAYVQPGTPVRLGDSTLTVTPESGTTVLHLSNNDGFGEATGASTCMRALFALLERAAPTDETILLLGESGTGKEVLARAIHDNSRRSKGPFVVVDCAALSPGLVEDELFGHARGAATGLHADRTGLLEEANGGTIFIDELGELPIDLQPKLLRAIENRQVRRLGSNEPVPFDARIIAATHRNLEAKIKDGSFRADLYFRLSVVEVHVPALRDRKEDIPHLVGRFLAARRPPATPADLPPRALALLQAYEWPGNVRELRNTVSRLLLFPEKLADFLGDKVAAAAQNSGSPGQGSAAQAEEDRKAALYALPLPEARDLVMEQFERGYIAERLKQHNENITRAAESMGVSRQLLHRLIERYGLRGK
jgi:DNA-binding NtrC family response regulator